MSFADAARKAMKWDRPAEPSVEEQAKRILAEQDAGDDELDDLVAELMDDDEDDDDFAEYFDGDDDAEEDVDDLG